MEQMRVRAVAAPVGREGGDEKVAVGEEEHQQRQEQIPCGKANKKGKGNSKSNGRFPARGGRRESVAYAGGAPRALRTAGATRVPSSSMAWRIFSGAMEAAVIWKSMRAMPPRTSLV